MKHLGVNGIFLTITGKKKKIATKPDREPPTKKISLSQTAFLEAVNFILRQPLI